ncbi:hypothetical protein SALBM217S_10741 [Streptomyces griseoloalbus]
MPVGATDSSHRRAAAARWTAWARARPSSVGPRSSVARAASHAPGRGRRVPAGFLTPLPIIVPCSPVVVPAPLPRRAEGTGAGVHPRPATEARRIVLPRWRMWRSVLHMGSL